MGPMLRARRRALDLTLEAVASQAGIATGFLSEIERDRASPSVASLVRLCAVLRIPVGSLFQSNQPELVRAGDREQMRYGGRQIQYELLSARTATRMSVVHAMLLPGGTSGDEPHMIQAEEEFIFILEGEMLVEVGGDRFHLFEGDALTHDPRRPHRYSNPSTDRNCRTICVLSPQPGT
jgi:transcriptional regulator with XRE-family HTH domain